MPKPPSRDAAAEVARVHAALEADDRSIAWLAKRADIADSTLRWQLANPERFTVENWLKVAGALGWDREQLTAEVAA